MSVQVCLGRLHWVEREFTASCGSSQSLSTRVIQISKIAYLWPLNAALLPTAGQLSFDLTIIPQCTR